MCRHTSKQGLAASLSKLLPTHERMTASVTAEALDGCLETGTEEANEHRRGPASAFTAPPAQQGPSQPKAQPVR